MDGLAAVLVLLGVCVACFALNRPRGDIVAVCAIVLLPALGIVGFGEAFSGFSDPSVILIALMFVVGEGLSRTGVSRMAGEFLLEKSGKSVGRLTALMMVAVAVTGSVMSSTGVVAIFIPIALAVSRKLRISPSQLMMPLSFAGLISGMMSLVATTPNMVTNSILVREGFDGFGFFSFTPVGLAVLAMGVCYMLFMRRFLGGRAPVADSAGRRTFADYVRDYALSGRERIFLVGESSPLAGKPLRDSGLRERLGASAVCIERRERLSVRLLDPVASTVLRAGDAVLCDMRAAAGVPRGEVSAMGLVSRPLRGQYFSEKSAEVGMAEIAVAPESELVGATVPESGFRSRYGLSVVGLRRSSRAVGGDIMGERLRMGDVLLVMGPWKSIKGLRGSPRDFIVLSLPEEVDFAVQSHGRAVYALISLAVMLALMIGGVLPNAAAAFVGCLLMVAFGCIDMDGAYRAVHWSSVLLVVGMIPFATALEKTGGVQMASQGLLDALGWMGPRAVMAGLFALTAVTGLFISNTVTAILLAPVAIQAANMLGVSPYPFAMTVAIAASTAFMTPISSPVNTLVWAPGRYSFADFLKIGVPFSAAVMAASSVLIPLLFPF